MKKKNSIFKRKFNFGIFFEKFHFFKKKKNAFVNNFIYFLGQNQGGGNGDYMRHDMGPPHAHFEGGQGGPQGPGGQMQYYPPQQQQYYGPPQAAMYNSPQYMMPQGGPPQQYYGNYAGGQPGYGGPGGPPQGQRGQQGGASNNY